MTSEVLNSGDKRSASMAASVAVFVGGATVGAIAALLLAPQAGRESRRQLSEYGRRSGEAMSEWATTASSLFSTVEKVKEAVLEDSGNQRERDETGIKSRPHALAR